MNGQLLPFALIGAALLVFLLSTRQFPFALRTIIWVVGAGLMVWAWTRSGPMVPADLTRDIGLLGEAVQNRQRSLLALAVMQNWPTVGGALSQMFNVFFFATAALGLVALIAFSPGEELERAGRPLFIGLFGAILGAFAALALVAVGFGFYPDRRVYVSDEVHVVDGDTIRMGDVALRLAGVDAPEFHGRSGGGADARDQVCLTAAGEQSACGKMAHDALVNLVADRIVFCERVSANESFGRVLAVCRARRRGAAKTDLAQALAQQGLAAPLDDEDRIRGADYSADIAAARRQGLGLWSGCTLRPDAWRNKRAREAFRARRFDAIAAEDFIGRAKCPPAAPPPAPAAPARRRGRQ